MTKGGSRPGSGRPSKPPSQRLQRGGKISLQVSQETALQLEALFQRGALAADSEDQLAEQLIAIAYQAWQETTE